ncbi:hypothetical protein SAMN05421676_11170 [Salinibacillus kushneri]|uniref:SurA N-terminal domain-containing protein n=1 Tax=Salinibacillus kushneri TaxID=237682 RepID=A0A1I0IC72_9BACI|nr:hypothetical protein [Salinibacillus kushneri]SET93468.1 hypothetical protein SAMN05421676_11170 [Salinibacillus kushneri]
MNKGKITVCVAMVIVFFAAFQMNTKGYLLFAPPLIEQEKIDERFELQSFQLAQIEDLDISKQKLKSDVIQQLIAQKALTEKAKEKELEVTEKELETRMDEIMEQAQEYKDEDYGMGAFLKTQDLSFEEYFNQYMKEEIKTEMFIDKLQKEWFKEFDDARDYNDLEEKRQEVIDDFKAEHQDEIERIKEENL